MPHKVLLVDDSVDIHDLVRLGLAAEPLELRICENSAVSLAVAAEWLPDLLLLDVDLPGLDGFEVCRLLKADPHTAPIQIVFLTGASSTREKMRGLELGAIDYVTKPFDPVELRARVRAALRTIELMNSLARETKNLRTSSEVLRMIAQDATIDDVQDRLVRLAEEEYPGSIASVVLLRRGLIEHRSPSMPAQLRTALEFHMFRLVSGLCSPAATRGDCFCDSDIASDPQWQSVSGAILAAGFSSCWHVVIRSATGGVMGVFAIYHRPRSVADDTARLFFEKTASLLAIATEHAELTDQLSHRAQHDPLTGLPNRSVLDARLTAAVTGAGTTGQAIGVVFIDVDRFKTINDTLGHLAGDLLLCQLADRLQTAIGDSGLLTRIGGDEFALILERVSDRLDAVRTCRRVLDAFKSPFQLCKHELTVTVSVGLSLFPDDGTDIITLQKNADVAMYRAKNGGRNAMQCFDHRVDAASSRRLELENELRRASAERQFELVYQPQVNRLGEIIAVEALLRWTHPVLGSVSPGEFIPLAEECGLIVPIGAWALREAAAQWRRWNEASLGNLRVAVNVSALQFAAADFVEVVRAAIEDHGMPARRLELELTEGVLMKNAADAACKLAALKAMGCSLAIDDFGTGYSSLAYLQRLPFDTLKIDRSFVLAIEPATAERSGGSDTAVIRAIISLARSMDKIVVAEGVETEFQRSFLASLGCEHMQGYLFGWPTSAAEISRLLESKRGDPVNPRAAAVVAITRAA